MFDLKKLTLTFLFAGSLILASAIPIPAQAAHLRWASDTVYVENKIGSNWPVRVATEIWDDSSALDMVVVNDCPAPTNCVTIHWSDLPDGTLGRTVKSYDGAGRIISADVRISDSIIPDYDEHRKTALIRHEIGHTLAFAHTETKTDVMYYRIEKDGPLNLADRHTTILRETYGAPDD